MDFTGIYSTNQIQSLLNLTIVGLLLNSIFLSQEKTQLKFKSDAQLICLLKYIIGLHAI